MAAAWFQGSGLTSAFVLFLNPFDFTTDDVAALFLGGVAEFLIAEFAAEDLTHLLLGLVGKGLIALAVFLTWTPVFTTEAVTA